MLYFVVPAFMVASSALVAWLLYIRLNSAAGKKMVDKRIALFTNQLFSGLAGLLNAGNHLEQEIAQPGYFEKIKPYIEKQVDDFLRIKLLKEMPVVGSLIGEQTILKLKFVFMDELKTIFPGAIAQYASGLNSNFAERIFSSSHVQQLQNNISESLHRQVAAFAAGLFVPFIAFSLVQGLIIDLIFGFLH